MTLLLASLPTAAWMFAMLCLGFVLGVILVCVVQAGSRGEDEHERKVWERVTHKER